MSILALTSNTLIGTAAAGNIEYNGQFYGTDSAAARAQMQRISQGTAVTCAGQTSIDFAALPAWVKRITVMLNGVSTSGTSVQIIQLGTGATPTYTTSGYSSGTGQGNTSSGLISSGFAITTTNAATTIYSGSIIITNLSGNTWVASGAGFSTATVPTYAGGGVALGAALTAIRITTVNGTDTFDTTPSAGTINILYEG